MHQDTTRLAIRIMKLVPGEFYSFPLILAAEHGPPSLKTVNESKR